MSKTKDKEFVNGEHPKKEQNQKGIHFTKTKKVKFSDGTETDYSEDKHTKLK